MATFGLIGPISQIVPVEESIKHVVLLIGLAVGVDYSLFYVRRMKEELAAGRDKDAALEAAAATSGHAVLVSGLTVMTAMAGMYLADSSVFTSFATGSILVVAVAMLGSLTVLPAVLSRVGHRLGRSHIPGLTRIKAPGGPHRDLVEDHRPRPAPPLAVRRTATAVMVALAIPATQMQLGQPALGDSLPQDEPVVQTFNRVKDAFPAETSAMQVVVKAKDVTAPAVAAGIEDLGREARAHGDLFPSTSTPSVDISPDKTVATIDLEIAGDGEDAASDRALDVLRDSVVPDTIGGVTGARAYVDGQTAQDRDFNEQMISHLPLRVRVRDRHRVHAAAGDVPVDRRPDQGDRAEPHVGRRRLRRDGAGLPARLVQGSPRLHGDRADRRLAAHVPVRGPVRPVDGLPRVHPQPGQGVRRHGRGHRGRRVARRSR